MAGLRGIVAGLAISSAIIALPIDAQSPASVSLVHTVSVTVPPRVKVQVAKLTVATPAAAVRVSSSPTNAAGLSLTVSANRAWVLAIGSGVATRKSRLQWSPDGRSQFSAVSTRDVAIASGDSSFDGKPANLFFRTAASAARSTVGYGEGESVVLTVSAP